MRIKLDENFAGSLQRALQLLGHDVDTVPDEGLRGEDDPTVWQAAQRAGRFFITQDLDFSDVRTFTPGSHEGILLVRLANAARRVVATRVEEVFRTEPVETWRMHAGRSRRFAAPRRHSFNYSSLGAGSHSNKMKKAGG